MPVHIQVHFFPLLIAEALVTGASATNALVACPAKGRPCRCRTPADEVTVTPAGADITKLPVIKLPNST